MEKVISNLLNLNSVPECYTLPPDKRPEKCLSPSPFAVPVIDLSEKNGQDRTSIVTGIMKASQEFGLFQVINHGIAENIINDMMGAAEEFFNMPVENRASLCSDDPDKIARVSTSVEYSKEETHYWRDSLRHPCHPLEKFRGFWPSKPTKYREITESYTKEVRGLSMRLLELISEGLGLESSYFEDNFSNDQLMIINHYPPCPDPSLTLGLPKHCDRSSITLLLQRDVAGLQALKNGEWFAVEPLRNAFVIILGHMLPVISNGKLKSTEHRAVTNSSITRTSIAMLIHPSNNNIIHPAQMLVDESNPPKFKAFTFNEYLSAFSALVSDPEQNLEQFKL